MSMMGPHVGCHDEGWVEGWWRGRDWEGWNRFAGRRAKTTGKIASKVEGILIGLFASCILYSGLVHLHTSHPDHGNTPTTKNLHIRIRSRMFGFYFTALRKLLRTWKYITLLLRLEITT
jgi:hypothetical protein